MDSLGLLKVFVQAAETRSFVAAGRQLGISASAVGKAVARLEDRLQVRLFHRSTRSIALTAEGSLFLERCRRIFCEMEAAEQELSQAKGAPRGKLRVSLPLVGQFLMPTLAGFMRAYPEVELDLDLTDRLVDVIDEGFDVVIRSGEVSDSRLMARALGSYRHAIIAAPDYLARRGRPRKPKDLTQHACLRYRYPTTGKLEAWPLRHAGRSGDALPATLVASTVEPLIYLAEQGLGLACVPAFTVRSQVTEGRLVPLLEPYLKDDRRFRLLWPSSRHLSPKLRAFVDFAADNLFREA